MKYSKHFFVWTFKSALVAGVFHFVASTMPPWYAGKQAALQASFAQTSIVSLAIFTVINCRRPVSTGA
jgi:hypothetical protein